MRSHLTPFLLNLLVLAMGTLLGIGTQRFTASREAAPRYLDQGLSGWNAVLGGARLEGRRPELSLRGKPVSDISFVKVSLYNRSDRAYKDVELYVELGPGGPGSGQPAAPSSAPSPLRLIGTMITGAHGLEHGVERVSAGQAAPAGGISEIYKIHSVNRPPNDWEAVFEATYLALGENAPVVRRVVVNQSDPPGLFVRASQEDEGVSWFSVLAPIMVMIPIMVLFGVGTAYLTAPSTMRQTAKLDETLRNAFELTFARDVSLQNPSARPDPGSLAERALSTFREFRRQNLPPFNQWPLNRWPPNEASGPTNLPRSQVP